MSALVTSVAPIIAMDVASSINSNAATIISHNQGFTTLANNNLSQNQPQQFSLHLLSSATAAQYGAGLPFSYANNYGIVAQNSQLQSHHQQLQITALQQPHLLAGVPYHQQPCTVTASVASSTSSANQSLTTAAVPATTNTTTSINRSQRCGVCRGCQCKPCGTCTYCQDSPQFGGPGVKKQSCIERRCLRVLENRLQRDAPTFKARVGCNKCDDCRSPDCQICLVCLDRRFFNNRYMNGALCAKKRCNNATSLELSPQSSNNNNSSLIDRNQQLKRSYESNGSDHVVTKRRGMDQKISQNGIKSDFQQLNNRNPNNISSPSNCSQLQTPSTTVITVKKNNSVVADALSQQQRQQLLHKQQIASQEFAYRGLYNSAPLIENVSITTPDNYRNQNMYTAPVISTARAANGETILQQHLPQNGNFYISSTSPFFATNNGTIPQQFDMAPVAAGGLATNHLFYQQQFSCNNYAQPQQKFVNYPKYEYYDEHTSYNTIQNNSNGAPPPDPFVPPSYSELKNAVVLQPL